MTIKKYLSFLLLSGKPSFPAQKNVLSFLHYIVYYFIFRLLFVCSLCYRSIVQLRFYLYQIGVLKRTSLSCPVISIGNITTGGTGKTPTVIEVARLLGQHGKRVVILSRGYRRDSSHPNQIVQPDTDVQVAGDEPLLIARKLQSKGNSELPDIPVIVGSQRYLSGKMAIERFQPDVILLDDGFQHIQLERTYDLVLIDATNPFGGGYMLPAGFLREPLTNLARANAFVITRSDEIEDIIYIENTLRLYNQNAPIFRGIHACDTIRKAGTEETIELEDLKGKRLLAVSGLANPASFLYMLDKLGLQIIEHLDFPDHHWYTEKDVFMIQQTLSNHTFDAIITTEKDESKFLMYCEDLNVPCYVLAIRFEIQSEERFEELFRQVWGTSA